MKKILCIDPGYSLIEAKKLFEEGNYPGHCLYGVNHLSKAIEVELEPNHGICGRIKAEFIHLYNYYKSKPDGVYLTFCDYGLFILILRKLRIIKKPIFVLFHGYIEDGSLRCRWKEKIKIKVVNQIRKLELAASDYPIFISKYAYDNAPSVRKQYISLMPEVVELPEEKEDRHHDCVISVGKTLRDYRTIYHAAKLHSDLNVKIVTNTYAENNDLANIDVIDRITPYKDVLDMYKNSLAICIPVQETGGGVYGLSSILDALAVGKPIIASKTIGLGLDIDELKIGCTYECGNAESFYEAYIYVRANYDEIKDNIRSLVEKYNAGEFGYEISKLILQNC